MWRRKEDGEEEGLNIRRADSHHLTSCSQFQRQEGQKAGMLFACSLCPLLQRSNSVLTYPVSVTVGLCGLGLCDQLEQQALRSSHTSAQHDGPEQCNRAASQLGNLLKR